MEKRLGGLDIKVLDDKLLQNNFYYYSRSKKNTMTVDTIELECALESITLEDNPPLTEKEKVTIRNKKYFMTENGKKRGTRLLKGIVLNILS